MAAMCTRAVVIDRGRLVADGDVPGLLATTGADTLEDAFQTLTREESVP